VRATKPPKGGTQNSKKNKFKCKNIVLSNLGAKPKVAVGKTKIAVGKIQMGIGKIKGSVGKTEVVVGKIY